MKFVKLVMTSLCALSLLAITPARADDDMMKKIINSPNVDSWNVYGAQTHTKIKDATVQGGSAIEVNVNATAQNIYDVAGAVDIIAPIHKGDHIIMVVWMKAKNDDGKGGQANLRVQVNAAPYTGLMEKAVTVTNNWQQYYVDAVAADDYAKGTVVANVQLAYGKQTIDLGPAFVLNLGAGK